MVENRIQSTVKMMLDACTALQNVIFLSKKSTCPSETNRNWNPQYKNHNIKQRNNRKLCSVHYQCVKAAKKKHRITELQIKTEENIQTQTRQDNYQTSGPKNHQKSAEKFRELP